MSLGRKMGMSRNIVIYIYIKLYNPKIQCLIGFLFDMELLDHFVSFWVLYRFCIQ